MNSFTLFLNANFADRIWKAAKKCLDKDNVRELPVKLKSAKITQVNTRNLFDFDDHLELPAIITVATELEEDGRVYRREFDMKAHVSGTLTLDFKDCCVSASSICPNRVRTLYKDFADDFLPYLDSKKMEKIARDILRGYDPYIREGKYKRRISATKLANALGIRVFYSHLSDCGSVRGVYVFEKSLVEVYDEGRKTFVKVQVPANSILIDYSLRDKQNIMRFTVMHEVVHAIVHKYALRLMRMTDSNVGSLSCLALFFENQSSSDNFIDRMEKQADKIAAFLLMNKDDFCYVVRDLILSYRRRLTAKNIEDVIVKTSAYFGVSISAVKKRMVECGFTLAEGVFCYVDDHYVPAFDFTEGSLKKGETFVISKNQMRKLLSENKKLLKMYISGTVCFVENHLVLNSDEYIIGHGAKARLTDKARNNLDKCAFKFRINYPTVHKDIGSSTNNGRIVFRSAESRLNPDVVMSDNNLSIEEKAKILKIRDDDITSVKKQICGDSKDAFNVIYKWSDMTEKEIAEESWTAERVIRSMLNEEDYQPNKKTLIRICIGMNLPSELSLQLIKTMVGGLRNSGVDQAYTTFLRTPELYTIGTCNQILELQDKPTLGGKEPGM